MLLNGIRVCFVLFSKSEEEKKKEEEVKEK